MAGMKMADSNNIILFRPDVPLDEAHDAPEDGSASEGTAEILRLEAEIAAKRDRVVASFGELRRRVEGVTDWRGWVREHPAVWIAGAVTVGFIIGYRGGPARR